MKKTLSIFSALAIATATVAPANAATLTEAFEDPFPVWESGWFGVNSNAQNYYGDGSSNRGNNPDGLWLVDGDASSVIDIVFNATFAASLTSLTLDVASFTGSTLTIFDAAGLTIFSSPVTVNSGAYTDPGTYATYGTTSVSGIGGFQFTGAAQGNLSIDNLFVEVNGAVPEPATWLMMLLGFGMVGGIMRHGRRSTKVAFAQ